MSVLFADLTGFTTYAEGRDSEDVRTFISDYFDRSREIIERFGGLVEKFIGDAVMAVWGAEAANEDDAERAVRAGFELVDVVAKLSADAGVSDLALRVGVHTGEAAVGPTDDRMGFVTGDLVNTASRLQSAAQPGTVLVGEPTKLASSRAIAYEPVGAQSLKGKSLPISAWRALRVVSERQGRGRAESLEPPFVGRVNELRLLKDMLGTVKREQRSSLISLVGEAGIGKSRLVWEFLKYIDGLVEDIYWHEGRSPSYGDGITFWALAEMIKSRAGILEDDSDEVTRARLDASLENFIADETDRTWIRPRLAAVLGIGEAPPGERSDLESAVRMYFEGVAAQGTTILVFEDLHWADAALIDFVDELTDWWRNQPILIVTMARPDLLDRHPQVGSGRHGVISITLGPLGERELAELVTGTVPGLPETAVQAIVERAAGIPLYAVELLRGLLAQGDLQGEAGEYQFVGDMATIAVPESLQAVIGARLDRLGADDRALIQDAAVLGQSFSTHGLAALTGRQVSDLENQLHQLTRREVVEPVRDSRSPELGQYRFLQGLIRDVALGRMSRETRRTRHLAAAGHFEAQEDPELAVIVATHYAQALEASHEGEERDAVRSKALASMLMATRRAADLRTHEQVLSISRTALDIADHDSERAEFWEMMLDSATRMADTNEAERIAGLALAHYRAIGDSAAELRVTRMLGFCFVDNLLSHRAVELLGPIMEAHQDLGTDPELARVGGIYARTMMLTGNPDLSAVERALEAAERCQLVPEVIDGLITKGTILGSSGRLTEARVLLEGAITLADRHDLGHSAVRGRNNLGFVLLGIDFEESRRVGLEAYQIARRSGDRGDLLFHTMQLGTDTFNQGDLEGAENILADPLVADPTPAIRIAFAGIELRIACWRGEMETATALLDEQRRLSETVDDVQILSSITESEAVLAVFSGDIGRAFELAMKMGEKAWFEALLILDTGLLAASLTRDRTDLERMLTVVGGHNPRFAEEVTLWGSMLQLPDPAARARVEEGLVRIERGLGTVAMLAALISAASVSRLEGGAEYLARARSIAEPRGWHGVIDLINRQFG